MRGSVLFIINNNIGGDSLAPRCLRPLGGLRPPSDLRPLWNLDPPADRGDHFILVLLVSQLGRFGRGKPRLLGLTAVLLKSLATLSLPHTLCFLRLFGLLLLLVLGPILGPELLVLWDWGRESLTIPIPYKRTTIKARARKKGNERKIGDKSSILPEKCNLSRGASAPPENPSDPSV